MVGLGMWTGCPGWGRHTSCFNTQLIGAGTSSEVQSQEVTGPLAKWGSQQGGPGRGRQRGAAPMGRGFHALYLPTGNALVLGSRGPGAVPSTEGSGPRRLLSCVLPACGAAVRAQALPCLIPVCGMSSPPRGPGALLLPLDPCPPSLCISLTNTLKNLPRASIAFKNGKL